MYGLVNQAIREFIVKAHGEPKWVQICEQAGVQTTEFVAMSTYPDQVTYALVGAISKNLNIPMDQALNLFGKYWVLYTGSEGYGPLMDAFGHTFKECLMNLNHLHARMGMTMPKLTPPKFEFKEVNANEYQLEYISERPGLCPMVQGLLLGLAEKYNTAAVINFAETDGKKIFSIEIIGGRYE